MIFIITYACLPHFGHRKDLFSPRVATFNLHTVYTISFSFFAVCNSWNVLYQYFIPRHSISSMKDVSTLLANVNFFSTVFRETSTIFEERGESFV